MTSPSDLPRITKRELTKVGIRMPHEDNVRDWMRRGWLEMGLYLWNQQRFHEYDQLKRIREERGSEGPIFIERLFDEDGA